MVILNDFILFLLVQRACEKINLPMQSSIWERWSSLHSDCSLSSVAGVDTGMAHPLTLVLNELTEGDKERVVHRRCQGKHQEDHGRLITL